MEYKVLNNGLKMPMVGLGVYNISERETLRVVEDAISVGYRSIGEPVRDPCSLSAAEDAGIPEALQCSS